MNLMLIRRDLITIFIIIISISNATALSDQEIGIQKEVTPKEVKLVGDYYFIDENPDPIPYDNSGSKKPDGIRITYITRIIGDLPDRHAKNTAYYVKLQEKIPPEARLVCIEQKDSFDPAITTPITAYDGTDKSAYYMISGDFIEIYLDSIPPAEIPTEIRINVILPKCVAPATLYNSALLRSHNDINRDNNYASINNYIGIAYDRRYSIEDFEALLNKSNCSGADDFQLNGDESSCGCGSP